MRNAWNVTIVARHVLIRVNIHVLPALKSITGYNEVIAATVKMDILKMK